MFSGTATALMTPFNKDYSIDYDSLRNLVEYQIEGGIDALIALGTTAESPVLSFDERKKIIETVVSATRKRVPVLVGTGTNDTQDVVLFNNQAEELGADGLLIVNPYYNKSTQKGLVRHFTYIAQRTKLPIMLYNVPSRTGMNMLPETVIEIHTKNKNVIAMKEASGDISQIAKLTAQAPSTLTVFSGNDDQTIPIMALGAKGIVSVFSNVFPSEMVTFTNLLLKGDFQSAQKLIPYYLPMMNALFAETSPAPLKYVSSVVGLCKNVVRMPLIEVGKTTETKLKEAYKLIGEATL